MKTSIRRVFGPLAVVAAGLFVLAGLASPAAASEAGGSASTTEYSSSGVWWGD